MEPRPLLSTPSAIPSTLKPPHSPGRFNGALLGLAVLLTGCLSPEAAVLEADEQIYALVMERREQILSEPASFSIAPAEDSLRQQLLSGKGLDDPSIQELSLDDCLEIAAENSRSYQSQKEQLYLAALDLTLERWRFGTLIDLGAGASASGDGFDDGSASAGADGSASRLFGNGGQVVTNIGASLFRAIGSGDGWDAIGNLGVSFTQPLLRGSAREVVMEPLTQAERNLVYAVRSFERFRRTFGQNVASRYYNLLLSRQTVANEMKNKKALELLSRRNRAHAEAGQLNEIEASQAAQSVLSSRNQLVTLEGRLNREMDSFKLFLGLPIDAEISLAVKALEELHVEDASSLLHGWTEIHLAQLALSSRLDFLNSLEQLIDSERQSRISADGLRAGLGLTSTLNASSTEGQPLSYSDDRLPWTVSLDLDLPVDQLPERNSYRRSLISLEARRRSMEELAESIRADLRDSIRSTQTTESTFRLQKETIALNERRVLSANMMLQAGRTETRNLLDAQRDLLSARNAGDQALVDFTLAKLKLYLQLELLEFDESGLVVHLDKLIQGPPLSTEAPQPAKGNE